MSNDRTAEILKYLSAMSHDIGDFRAEMNKRIDDLRLETNTRIDELRAEMNTRDSIKLTANNGKSCKDFLRIEGMTLTLRGDSEETQERVAALEEKAGIEFVRQGI